MDAGDPARGGRASAEVLVRYKYVHDPGWGGAGVDIRFWTQYLFGDKQAQVGQFLDGFVRGIRGFSGTRCSVGHGD